MTRFLGILTLVGGICLLTPAIPTATAQDLKPVVKATASKPIEVDECYRATFNCIDWCKCGCGGFTGYQNGTAYTFELVKGKTPTGRTLTGKLRKGTCGWWFVDVADCGCGCGGATFKYVR